MVKTTRTAVFPYVVAVFATAVAVGVRWFLDPWLNEALPVVTLFGAIAVAVWFGGYGPALLAVGLGWLACEYLFVEPRGALRFDDIRTLVGGIAYLVSSAIIIGFGEALRTSRSRAKQQQELLRTTEVASRQLAAIVESSDDAIVSKDLKGIVTSWNRAAERIFGYSAEEMVGQPVAILIPPDHSDEEPAILQQISRGERVVPYETVRRRKDGTLIPIFLTVSPMLDANGRVVGASKIARDITERKQQQAALRRAGDQLRQITDALPVLISLIDTNAHYRLNNRAYEEWFQRPRSEVTGRHMRDVLGDAAWAVIGPKVEAALAGEPVRYEAEIVYKGTGRRWISATYTPQFDSDGKVVGVAVLVLDITDRKRAEEALRRWEHIFQHAGWSVAVADARANTLTAVNPAYAALHGYTVEELIGKPLADVFAAESRGDLQMHVQAAHEKGDHVYESIHVRKDGTRFPCLTHVTAFKDSAGNVEYRAATLQDLTTIRAAEDELREADRRKDEFLATLAHELRNPLAPIRNAVQVLKARTHAEPHVMWGRDVIDRQVQIMARLLEDLLDVSRISRNKLALRKQRVELAAVMDSAVETSRPLIDAGNHELTLDLPSEPVALEADPVRLAQVFSNLLNNAAKFSKPDGRIQVIAQRQGSNVAVSVKDDGIGIAADVLPHMFELFSQAPQPVEQRHGGLGMGLSLARALIELHGGSIGARSDGPGRGSELIVRLPVAAGVPAQEPVDPKVDHAPRIESKRRVLVVDDHRDSAESLAMMLQVMGHEVHLAYDGEEALTAARELQPDVVLLDIGMPKLNGHDACRRIREQPWGKRMRIIAMTGWGQQEDRRRTEEAGFDYHMVKPVDPAELAKLLASYG